MAIHKLKRSRKTGEVCKEDGTEITEDGQYGDGGGVWYVRSKGGKSKSFVLRYTSPITGKERRMGLGTSMKEARDKADAARDLIAKGIDPQEERDQRKEQRRAKHALTRTFRQVADECYEKQIVGLSEGYCWSWRQHIRERISSEIGNRNIQSITRNTVLNEMGFQELWDKQRKKAKMLRTVLKGTFAYAKSCGYFVGESPVEWDTLKGALSKRRYKKKHHAWLPLADVPRFMKALRVWRTPYKPYTRPVIAFMLEFVILTWVRQQEVRNARWKEISPDWTTWTVPPQYKLANLGHRDEARMVPITEPMREVLREMDALRGPDRSPEALIFPVQKYGCIVNDMKPYNEWAIGNWLLKSFKWERHITGHGVSRSTSRDWSRKKRHPGYLWKMQVDHVVGEDDSDDSYGHDKMEEDRREMMEKWGEYCSSEPEPSNAEQSSEVELPSNVVSVHERKSA
jgi:integrase